MEYFGLLIFSSGIVLIILGLVKPSIFSIFMKNITSLQAVVISLFISLFGLVIIVIFVIKIDKIKEFKWQVLNLQRF